MSPEPFILGGTKSWWKGRTMAWDSKIVIRLTVWSLLTFDICDSMTLWRTQGTSQKNISLLSHNIHAFTIAPLEALLFRYLNTKTLFVRYLTGDDMVLSRFCFLPPQQVLSVKRISSHNVSQNSTYISLGIQITPLSSTADSILCTESVF